MDTDGFRRNRSEGVESLIEVIEGRVEFWEQGLQNNKVATEKNVPTHESEFSSV